MFFSKTCTKQVLPTSETKMLTCSLSKV